MLDNEKREIGKWWAFSLLLLIITIGVLSFTGYLGKITGTFVERKVFEESYQKKAGDDARTKAYKSQLAQLQVKLNSSTISDEVRTDLESQKAMLQIQLAP